MLEKFIQTRTTNHTDVVKRLSEIISDKLVFSVLEDNNIDTQSVQKNIVSFITHYKISDTTLKNYSQLIHNMVLFCDKFEERFDATKLIETPEEIRNEIISDFVNTIPYNILEMCYSELKLMIYLDVQNLLIAQETKNYEGEIPFKTGTIVKIYNLLKSKYSIDISEVNLDQYRDYIIQVLIDYMQVNYIDKVKYHKLDLENDLQVEIDDSNNDYDLKNLLHLKELLYIDEFEKDIEILKSNSKSNSNGKRLKKIVITTNIVLEKIRFEFELQDNEYVSNRVVIENIPPNYCDTLVDFTRMMVLNINIEMFDDKEYKDYLISETIDYCLDILNS